MERLLVIVSWTGWTKEDWKELLCKFTPVHWMSKTGWTKAEWKKTIFDYSKVAGLGLLGVVVLYLFFISGLAV